MPFALGLVRKLAGGGREILALTPEQAKKPRK